MMNATEIAEALADYTNAGLDVDDFSHLAGELEAAEIGGIETIVDLIGDLIFTAHRNGKKNA